MIQGEPEQAPNTRETGSGFICIYYKRSELAHSSISVPHIIVHVPSTTFTYIFVRMRMSKLAHMHILPDHVTLSIS